MSFEIDFNTSSADQRVKSLTKRIDEMSAAATKASASLIPPDKAVTAMQAVAKAQSEIARSMEKASKASETTAKKVMKDANDTENGLKKFFTSLDKSLLQNSHNINAWSGKYGQATQDMVKANASLKKNALELANHQKMIDAARVTQAKQTNAQIVATEKASAATRTRDWTEYYKKQESQINRYNTALESSRKVIAKVNAEQRNLANGMDASGRSIKSNTSAMFQANQATAAMRAGLGALGTSIGIYTSGTMVVATATYAYVAAMKSAVTIGAEFENSMYRVFAVTGNMGSVYADNGEIIVKTTETVKAAQDALTKSAIDASTATVFSAVEAAEGMVALGMAGLNAQQAIGTLAPSLQLAQIGMISVYESADIMTNVMLGFGMAMGTTEESMQSATLVTDVLAAAVTNSNSTINEMAKALSYVAPISAAAGGSIYETVAALEAFHNVGIKSSRAGTALRRAYVNLLDPGAKAAEVFYDLGVSVRESNGDMRSLNDIMADLKASGAGATEMISIFGVRAAPAMIAFMDNLKGIQEETRRLGEDSKGAAEEMANFMASSTSAQWGIIGSKIKANLIESFMAAEGQIKELNLALMTFFNDDPSGMFDALGESVNITADRMAGLVDKLQWVLEKAGQVKSVFVDLFPKDFNFDSIDVFGSGGIDILTAGADKFLGVEKPKTKEEEDYATTQSKLLDVFAPKLPDFSTEGAFDESWGKLDFSPVAASANKATEAIEEATKAKKQYTEDSANAAAKAEEFSKQAEARAKIDAKYAEDKSLQSSVASTKRQMELANEAVSHREGLDLISKETALSQQLANIESAKTDIAKRYSEEIAKQEAIKEKARTANVGSSDLVMYEGAAKKIESLRTGMASQMEQLDKSAQSMSMKIQEASAKSHGYGTLAKDVDSLSEAISIANKKLEGNKQATHESSLANLQNAVALREAYQASSEFNSMSEQLQRSFENETNAAKAQIPAIQALIDKNKELTDAKKDKIEADKKQRDTEKLINQFGKGKGLGEEGQGLAKYKEEIVRFQEYETNKQAIMQEFGYSEIEFHNMMVEAKLESEQRYWDSQHENLATWRDEWSTAIADNVEQSLFMEQSWSQTAQNISRTILGSVVNSMIQIGAEMAANAAMKAIFGSQEIAMDTAITTSKVAGEVAKTAAVTTTAAVEATATTGALAYFSQMLAFGPTLAAAWAPAAMYINIASFGAAGMAAAGSTLLAGIASAGAGIMAGVGGAAGEMISGGRQFGGDVTAGNSYLVGETGREIFTPTTSGYITSNQDSMSDFGSGKSGDTYVTYDNKYYIDATGNEDIEERLQEAMEEASDRGLQKVINDFATNGDAAKLARRNARS